jgi:ribosome-binding ATPase YchF (GTP1/OBG family)
VSAEFILHDLLFIEKRLERIDRGLGKLKDERLLREREILIRLKDPLEQETPLRVVDIVPEDEKVVRSYPLLSARAMVVVLNVSDTDLSDTSRLAELTERYKSSQITFLQIAAAVEAEIAALESAAERAEFMKEMCIDDPALQRLTRACLTALSLVSFFTVARNEVRHWLLRRGSNAVEAAAKIHSDMSRGFIRAEVIKSADLFELGSEDNVKNAGRLSIKGRDYAVEDGDILFIRFSV